MTSPASWSDDPVLGKVKKILIENCGVRAFADGAALFRRFDKDNSGFLSHEEFASGLSSIGAKLTKQEMNYLMLAFDDNRDGKISLQEFVGELVYPQMNRRRQRLVITAFDALNVKLGGDGDKIKAGQLRGAFDVSQHPEVKAGRVPPHIIEKEMDAAFSEEFVADGFIDLNEFKCIVSGISSCVPSDEVFEELIMLCFCIDTPEHPTFASTQRDWTSTRGGKDDLEYTPHRPDDAYSKVLQGSLRQKGYNTTLTKRPQPDREPRINKSVKPDYVSTTALTYGAIPRQEAMTLNKMH